MQPDLFSSSSKSLLSQVRDREREKGRRRGREREIKIIKLINDAWCMRCVCIVMHIALKSICTSDILMSTYGNLIL